MFKISTKIIIKMDIPKFQTAKERSRANRNLRIRRAYSELRQANPDVSDNRIFNRLSAEYKLTMMSIRSIVLSTDD